MEMLLTGPTETTFTAQCNSTGLSDKYCQTKTSTIKQLSPLHVPSPIRDQTL